MVQFTDSFTPNASPDWSDRTGNWTTSNGTYFAQVPNNSPTASTFLPFDLSNANQQVTVTVNNLGDGGIWIDADGNDENGILLVLGGNGYGQGTRGGDAGTSIYWHVVTNGSFSGAMEEDSNVFTPGDTYTITVTVNGDNLSAYVDPDGVYDANSTLLTTLTTSAFSSGEMGLYDSQPNTTTGSGSGPATSFSNFSLQGTEAPCFAAGTTILTTGGSVAVERLRAGDRVVNAFRLIRPVRWVGYRRIDCRHHARPRDVWPIQIRAGAFGIDTPFRDVWLSPDHAVFADNVLIPIKHLINGTTIVQEARDAVTYWHVELERHDVLLAEGLPCESYLDTGNRAMFANGCVTNLHASFAKTAEQAWAHHACAPLIEDGARLAAVQEAIAARAIQLGLPVVAISSIEIAAAGPVSKVVPAEAESIRLVSLSDRRGGDRRRLGALVRRLCIDGAPIALDDNRVGSGFHEIEVHGEQSVRWTNGNATLALGRGVTDRMVEIDIAAVITDTPEQRFA